MVQSGEGTGTQDWQDPEVVGRVRAHGHARTHAHTRKGTRALPRARRLRIACVRAVDRV